MHAFPTVAGSYGLLWQPSQLFNIVIRRFDGGYQAILAYSNSLWSDSKVAMTTDTVPTIEEAMRILLEETGEHAAKALLEQCGPEFELHEVAKDGVKGLDHELLKPYRPDY